MNLINHYRKLWFFNFNRLKDNNYGTMREYFADILIDEMRRFLDLQDKKILDVGGARGEFCKIINRKYNCRAFNLDPEPLECGRYESNFLWPDTKIGSADSIPFNRNEFDLVICRGVIEHIPSEKQQASLNELYRVTKVGGFCYLAFPPWFNPTAGHGLKPFHYLPFRYAKILAEFAYKKKITAKSWQERKLFPITCSKMLKMVSSSGFKIAAVRDTHLRIHFLAKIPFIREVLIPTVSLILSKEVGQFQIE